jgi:SpoIIAA-like
MPIQLNEEDGGRILVVHVSGKLVTARLAIIGKKTWQEGMATFCKPFTTATLRYFDHADAVGARRWLGEA